MFKVNNQPKKKLTDDEKRELKKMKRFALIKDHFNRELEYVDYSQQRIGTTHFETTEKIKKNEVIKEVTTMVQCANRLMNQTENVVKVAQIYQEHAVSQHQKVQTIQLVLINNLTDLFRLFQNSLNEMYEINRQKLMEDFLSEKKTRKRILYEQKKYHENYAHASVSMLKSRLEKGNEKFTDNKVNINAETVVKHEEMANLKIRFESKICDLVKDIFKNFRKTWTKDRLQEYQIAVSNDKKLYVAIEKVSSNVRRAENEVKCLKKLLEEVSFENSLKLSKLKFERNSLLKLYTTQKFKIKKEADCEHEKLKALVESSRKALVYLDATAKSIQRIYSTFMLCRKKERIEDKITAYHDSGRFEVIRLQESADSDFQDLAMDCSDLFVKNKDRNLLVVQESCLSNLKSRKEGKDEKQFQTFGDIENDLKFFSNFKDYSSERNPSKPSIFQSATISLILDNFHDQFGAIETDCVMLRQYKYTLMIRNRMLKELLSTKRHEYDVNENLKRLQLYGSPSVGKIGQISHQMSQISNEIITQKCRKFHLYKNKRQ